MRRGTALVPSRDGKRHDTVEVIHLETSDDLITLRESDWHDGRMRVMRFGTAPAQGFISNDPPARSLRFMPGAYIYKTPEGLFGFLKDEKGFTPS